MSGPYDCFVCGGLGVVDWSADEYGPMRRCPDCNGTGERWLETVFSPSQEDRQSGRVEFVGGKWRFKDGQNPYVDNDHLKAPKR